MNELVEVVLGGEAVEHIEYCLRNGNTLASYLLRQFDLNAGRATTFVPPAVRAEAVKELESGGKLPPGPRLLATAQDGSQVIMQRIPDSNAYLAGIIYEFLREGTRRACVFEDALARATDPDLTRLAARLMIHGQEVYHLLLGRDAEMQTIADTIRQAYSIPIFIGALTYLPGEEYSVFPSQRVVTSDELRSLAERTERIIVGAYDGEGFLVWSRA